MSGNKWSLRFLNPPFVRADACLMPSIKVWDSTETLLCGENRCFSLPAPSGIPSYNPNCISIRWEWLCTAALLPPELVMLFLSQCCCCLEKQMERPLVTPCDASAQPLLLLWHILSSSGRLYPASVLPIVFISHWETNKHLTRVLESWVVTCVEVFFIWFGIFAWLIHCYLLMCFQGLWLS